MNSQHSIHSFSNGNFVWWEGVVENNVDPEKMGRVQIRAAGYHSPDKGDIPTEALPWAIISLDPTNAGVSGVGASPTGIVQGSLVWGFFRDGDDAQLPVIVGVIATSSTRAPEGTRGFNDPDEEYPRTEYLGESDTNRLARNSNIDKTIVKDKRDGIKTDVKTAFDNADWSEPKTEYDAKYPKNHVHESESGHIHEIDDTPGKERLHKYHKSGTFEEIHPDGTTVTKIVKDNYMIIAGDNFLHVAGGVNLSVDGDVNLYVKGNANAEIDGDYKAHVKGDYTLDVDGNIRMEAKQRMWHKAVRIDWN